MKSKTVSQKGKVKWWLLKGKSITPLEALNYFDVFRLSAIIFDLRNEGMNIETEYVINSKGNRFAKYSLKKDSQ